MLSGLSSMATRQLLAELAQAAPVAIRFESVGGVDALARVQAGEAFDLVVLAEDAVDKLAAQGLLLSDTIAVIAESSVAIAVPAGAKPPDIGSADALRRAVLSAYRIGYSTGPSGAALLKLFERWGLAETLRDRLLQSRPGEPVAALLAGGQVDLGFQQLSELLDQPGIALLGGMPPGTEIVTRFVGAIGAGSSRQPAARAALAFLASPANAHIKRRHGMAQPQPRQEAARP